MPKAEIGVFGGFYSFLEDVDEVEVETAFGSPSAPFVIGDVGGKRVAFLPRHGRNHELPPHMIPYRATCGRSLVSLSAVHSFAGRPDRQRTAVDVPRRGGTSPRTGRGRFQRDAEADGIAARRPVS